MGDYIDGALHYVISHRDPGIQNWLDTESHSQGLIMMRWQGTSTAPAKAPFMKLVKFDALDELLPENTPKFSAAERARQISARQLAVKKRFP